MTCGMNGCVHAEILSSLRLDKHLRDLQSSSLKHPQSMTCRLLSPFLALFPLALCGQIDGDNIFSVDQVIAIDLSFPQNNFWSLLEANSHILWSAVRHSRRAI